MFFSIMLLSAIVYFIPTIVARHRTNAGGVFILNLLLGWTLIGWVLALAWATTGEDLRYGSTVIVSPSNVSLMTGRNCYCPGCGGAMHLSMRFCPNCGKPSLIAQAG